MAMHGLLSEFGTNDPKTPQQPLSGPGANSLQAEIAQLEAQIAQLQGGGQMRQTGGMPQPGGPRQSPPQMPQAPGGGMPPGQMQQIYGLLAQYGDDPAQVGQQYVQSMQSQQQLNAQNDPNAVLRSIYGKVNPYDWSASSLQKFHTNYVKTGEMKFDLLKPKQGLSEVETRAILEADADMNTANADIGKIGGMLQKFADPAIRSQYTAGLKGTVEQWLAENITGNMDDVAALKKDVTRLFNTGVINSLPPGVASDRDIAIAKQGWPGPNVKPDYLESFLRGMQKLAVVESARQMHRSNYLGMMQTPQGLSRDWIEKRDAVIMQALQMNGLKLRHDDKKMSPYQTMLQTESAGRPPAVTSQNAAQIPQSFDTPDDAALDKRIDQMLGY